MGKGRRPCCDKEGVKRGPWSEAEDLKLISFIHNHGHSNWRALPKLAGLARCGKSCRLRWVNYLRPDLKRGDFTLVEEEAIIKLHGAFGNKWSKIASQFPGRTDNEIKNVWNTHLKKRIKAKSSSILNEIEEGKNKECPQQQQQQQQQQQHGTDRTINSVENMTIDVENSSSSSSSSSYTSLLQDSFRVSYHQMKNVNMRLHEGATTPKDVIEIPLEPNLDLWNLLEDDVSCNTHELVQLKELIIDHPSHFESDKKLHNNYGEDGESLPWWLIYLENELGFGSF